MPGDRRPLMHAPILRVLFFTTLLGSTGWMVGCVNRNRSISRIQLWRNSERFEQSIRDRFSLGLQISEVEQQMRDNHFRCSRKSVPAVPPAYPGQPSSTEQRRKYLICGRNRQWILGNRVWVAIFHYDEDNAVTNIVAYTELNVLP